MVDQAKLNTLKHLLAACQYGQLSQAEGMPECVTHFTKRGVENLLTANVEGYFAFKNEHYAALLVFVANELPDLLAELQRRLSTLENCRDILEKVNQGHHLGFASHDKINAAIAATRT